MGPKGAKPVARQLSLIPMRPERKRDHYDDWQRYSQQGEESCATGQAIHRNEEPPIAGNNSQQTPQG